ncbi:MAG TPA: PRC-barrel domain-containing protein [Pseudolabrys sp.]|nr:PRC-barrel domain-containing protein [Pseudolabrys sp.]
MKCLALTLALATALVVPALAQNAPPAPTATTTHTYVAAKPSDVLARSLIGLNITNPNRETIGEIEDLLISSDGKFSGYIVSVGGFLGMGERYVVVSPPSLRVNYSENDKKWTAEMDATKDNLKTAPEFKYEGKWAK